MNDHNQFNISHGPYVDDKGWEIVVLDVITHAHNSDVGLQELLPTPLVVARDLMILTQDVRYSWPLDVFKEKFKML